MNTPPIAIAGHGNVLSLGCSVLNSGSGCGGVCSSVIKRNCTRACFINSFEGARLQPCRLGLFKNVALAPEDVKIRRFMKHALNTLMSFAGFLWLSACTLWIAAWSCFTLPPPSCPSGRGRSGDWPPCSIRQSPCDRCPEITGPRRDATWHREQKFNQAHAWLNSARRS